MKNLAILFCLVFIISALHAQNDGIIQGKVFGKDKAPLSLATVTVFTAQDTAIITYRMSNDNGNFKIPNLPLNKGLRLLVTYSGYEAYRHNFTLTAEKPVYNLDSVWLLATDKVLDEVIVSSERPPVMMKNDTIEFNANAFKTLPNALVEDLLKKLPGVRVDADGNITVNGKPVNKILVDGKSFFGDDPKMASRNLPANAIDKVQVVDDKEQAMLNGDNNTSNVGKVVNITLKKGFKKGAFGKVYAGGGTKDRYEAGGIVNAFRDTLQVSVLGYSNNLNRPGFSYGELMNAGGLQRSNSNRSNNFYRASSNDNGSSISINGINFGGVQGFGLTTSNGAGININHAPDKKKSFYLQYYFGEVKTKRETEGLIQQFNSDTTISSHTLLNGTTTNYGHSIGAGFRLKPDSVTTVRFNAGYTIGLQRDAQTRDVTASNNILGQLSQGNILQNNHLDNYNYNHDFVFMKYSRKKKGRNFIIVNNVNIGTNNSDYRTDSRLNYFYPTSYDSVQYQLRQVRLPQTSVRIIPTYVEPLLPNLLFQIRPRYNYTYVHNKVNTFNAVDAGADYSMLNPLLTNTFKRNSHELTVYESLIYKLKSWTLTPWMAEGFMYVHNEAGEQKINQNTRKWLPGFELDYKNFTFVYSKNLTLPSYTYLIPVMDNTNPYYITNGNIDLQPKLAQNLNVNYNFSNQKNNLNVWLYATASFADNDVIQKTVVDEQGIQTTTPVNANGSSSYYLNFNIDKDFKFGKNNTFTLSGGGSYSIDRSRMRYNADSSWQRTVQLSNWVGFHLNINDVFEWDNSYDPGFNFTRYSSPLFGNLNVTTQDIASGIVVRWPKHIIWEHNFDYTYNSSLASSNRNMLRWTAAINFTFLKDERGVLKITAYDILDQNKNVQRIIASSNTLSFNRGNMMPRYLMATFTYNIRSVGGKKQKVGGESLFSL